FELLQAADDRRRRPNEPRFLPNAFLQLRHSDGRSWRTPRTTVLVGIAHKSEWREPLVALIVERPDSLDAFFDRRRQVQSAAPRQVFSRLEVATRARCFVAKLAKY